jgi:hypothetical protein
VRIVALLLATLCLVASAALGVARSNTNFTDAKDFEDKLGGPVDKETIAAARAAGVKSAGVLEIKPGALRRGAVGLIFTGVLSLVLLAAVFVRRGVPLFAAALLFVSALTIMLNPQYDVGDIKAMSARSAAFVVASLAAAGAFFAFLADRAAAARARRRAASRIAAAS